MSSSGSQQHLAAMSPTSMSSPGVSHVTNYPRQSSSPSGGGSGQNYPSVYHQSPPPYPQESESQYVLPERVTIASSTSQQCSQSSPHLLMPYSSGSGMSWNFSSSENNFRSFSSPEYVTLGLPSPATTEEMEIMTGIGGESNLIPTSSSSQETSSSEQQARSNSVPAELLLFSSENEPDFSFL